MTLPLKELLKTSWRAAWRRRNLWIFGLLVTEGTFLADIDGNTLTELFNRVKIQNAWPRLQMIFGPNAPTIILFSVLGLLFLLFSVLSVMSKTALLKGIAAEREAKSLTWREGFRYGRSKFWSIFALDVLFVAPNAIFGGLLVAAFYFGWGFWPAEIIFWLAFAYNIFLLFIRQFAYCAIVFHDEKFRPALASSFDLLRNNFHDLAGLVLARIGFSLLFLFITILAALLAVVPFALLMILSALIASWIVPFVIAILGFLAALVVIGIMKAVSSSFGYHLFAEAYWKLR
jgi:hypothetical protein